LNVATLAIAMRARFGSRWQCQTASSGKWAVKSLMVRQR
jgi:hypothetical protein